MKISKFIDKLNNFKNSYGDLDMFCVFDIFDDTLTADENGNIRSFEITEPKTSYLEEEKYGAKLERLDRNFFGDNFYADMLRDNEGKFPDDDYRQVCVLTNLHQSAL